MSGLIEVLNADLRIALSLEDWIGFEDLNLVNRGIELETRAE